MNSSCDSTKEICLDQPQPTTKMVNDSYWFSEHVSLVGLIFYWIWGITTAAMVTNGILVYFWEIKAVQESSLYCPAVASATTIWNSSNCMDTNPIK